MKFSFYVKINGFFLFLMLLFSGTALHGQGWENFDHSNATTTYRDGSFTGNNNLVWNYIASRDENGDANNSGIDGKALMLRRASDDSKVFAENIPNGIRDFNVKLYKGFTSSGTRKIELFINGISFGQSSGFNDYDEHVFEVQNINIEGEFTLEIRNVTNYQIIVDDISWTSFEGNELPPSITDVQQIPREHNVTPADPVSVNAAISAIHGVQFTELYWGLNSGNLSNTIEMVWVENDLYETASSIPSQPAGTTVFYQIIAWDFRDNSFITQEFSYIVYEPQWLSLPYFNSFRTEEEWDTALDEGFEFSDVNHEPAGEGYLKIASEGYIITPSIDFEGYTAFLTYFDVATWGGNRQQELTVSVSEDNGETFLPLNSYLVDFPNASYGTYAQYVDLRNLSGNVGRIKFEMTGGSASIRFRDLNIEVFQGFVYDNEWIPQDPNLHSQPEDDIFILQGITRFTENIQAKNLYVERETELYVDKILKIHGDKILVDGDLIFAATLDSVGELDVLEQETHVRGEITAERYFSEKRAFRMISSSITTETPIREHWQEGVNNTEIDPQYNQNPNPGFGTHITGNPNGEFGFDATIDGAPSLFEDNVLIQEFVPVENTDVDKIQSGIPYLIFVRGDRGIDLTDEEDVSETILRTKGSMPAGDRTKTFPTMNPQEFAMFGNPYQSAIDLKELFLFDSEKINSSYYYVYDANLGDYGAFVTVHLSDGSNFFESQANQFLQPGQAAQFITVDFGGPEMRFKERHKSPGNHTATNRPFYAENSIILQFFTLENHQNNEVLHDALGLAFDPFYTNSLTPADAIKPMNFFENFAIDLNGELLSFEQREMPITGDFFQLYASGFQHENYVVKMKMNGFEDAVIYFEDHYTGERTLFVTGETEYAFEIDFDEPLSMAADRFSIQVDYRLEINSDEISEIVLYPNPMSDYFKIKSSNLSGTQVEITIKDIQGREINRFSEYFLSNEKTVFLPTDLDSGIYFVSLQTDEFRQDFKVIKN